MKTPLKIPLTNMQRILILKRKVGGGSNYLSDLERDHFGTNARSTMKPFMVQYVADYGSFDYIYDTYLLYLWDQLITPPTPPGAGGESGVPIGFMNLGLTYA